MCPVIVTARVAVGVNYKIPLYYDTVTVGVRVSHNLSLENERICFSTDSLIYPSCPSSVNTQYLVLNGYSAIFWVSMFLSVLYIFFLDLRVRSCLYNTFMSLKKVHVRTLRSCSYSTCLSVQYVPDRSVRCLLFFSCLIISILIESKFNFFCDKSLTVLRR